MSEQQPYDPRYERLQTNSRILTKLYQEEENPQSQEGWYVSIVIDHLDEDTGLQAGPFTHEQAEQFYNLVKLAGWYTWVEIDGPFASSDIKPFVAVKREQPLYPCRLCSYLVTKPNSLCHKHF